MLFIFITLLIGMLTPIQTAANARLRLTVDKAYVATLISFAVSSLSLLVVSVVADFSILPTAAQIDIAPGWSWFGGVLALLSITCNIYLFKELGQLQATIIPLFSQLVFSLCIDHFGLFGAAVIPMNIQRVIGTLLLIFGVVLVSVLPKLRSKNNNETGSTRQWFWQIMAVGAGCIMATIGAVYALLGSVLKSAVQASTVSFVIATAAMLVFCIAKRGVKLVPKAFSRECPWWMWLGGISGAICVVGNAWLIPKIGVGVFAMAILAGQLSLSLLMEHFGWLGAPQKHISSSQIVGIVLMVAGVAMIRI